MGWLQDIGGAIGNAWHDVTGGDNARGRGVRNVLGGVGAAALGGFIPGVQGLSIGGATAQSALQGALGASTGSVANMGKAALTGNTLSKAGNAAKTLSGILGPASAIYTAVAPPVSTPTAPNILDSSYSSKGMAEGRLTPELQDVYNRRISELLSLDTGGFDDSTYDKLLAENQLRVSEEQAERGRYGSSDTDRRRADTSAMVDLAKEQDLFNRRASILQQLEGLYNMGTQADQINFDRMRQQADINSQYDMMKYNRDMSNRDAIAGVGSQYLSGGSSVTDREIDRIMNMLGVKNQNKGTDEEVA